MDKTPMAFEEDSTENKKVSKELGGYMFAFQLGFSFLEF